MNGLNRQCFSLALSSLAALASAQSTHVVGGGGLPQIRDALSVAQPGDTILVHPGTYAHFAMNVGVTLRAVTPGTVQVLYDMAYWPPGCTNTSNCPGEGPTRFAIPTGQQAVIQGIRFQEGVNSSLSLTHSVFVDGGVATFDQCVFRAYDANALYVSGAQVQLLRCTIQSLPSIFARPALGVGGAPSGAPGFVSALDCTMQSQGGLIVAHQGYGVAVWANGTFFGCRSTIQGASHSSGANGGKAVRNNTGGHFWISDSTLVAGAGGCAFENPGTGIITRCVISSSGTGCTSAATAPLLGAQTSGPLLLGTTYSLLLRDVGNQVVVVFAGTQPGFLALPELAQPALIDLSTAFPAWVGATDAGGTMTASWAIPANPALVGLGLWFQGINASVMPMRLSPLAGGLAI